MTHSHEPLIHIAKRDSLVWWKGWLIRLISLLLALIVSALFIYSLTKLNPVKVYGAMWDGAFGTAKRSWVTVRDTAFLLCIGIGLAPAFMMRFWNVGGEGQILMGGLATAACMIVFGDKLPNGLLILTMVVTSIAAGAIWGAIPAVFKAKWNTNETLFTLMMNYVAIQLVAFFVIVWEVPKGAGKIGIINQNSQAGWFPQIGGNKYFLNVIIVIILIVLIAIYMNYSKNGYELAVVGESEPTARYVGIKVNKVIIRTMVLSGAVCGLAGLLLVGASDHTLTTTLVDGRGFTGVIVAWLGKFNPVYMILTTFLLVFLDRGATEITTIFGLNQNYGDIITGIILFFILGCEFFLNYRISLTRSGKGEVA